MPLPLSKAHNLILDRRAIPRAGSFNPTCEHGGPVKPLPKDRMCGLVRISKVHWHQFVGNSSILKGKRLRGVVAVLCFEARKVDTIEVNSWRSPRLQPPAQKAEPLEIRSDTP